MTTLESAATMFAVCLASGYIPVVNAEASLLAASALSGAAALPALVLAATCGQMVAKSSMYLAGRGVVTLPFARRVVTMQSVAERLQRSKGRVAAFIFTSASVGLPPFYVVSIAAGAFRVGLWRFVTWGWLGRLLRFGLVAAAPQLVRSWLS